MSQNQECNNDTATVNNLNGAKKEKKTSKFKTKESILTHTHTRVHACLHFLFQLSGCNHMGT